MSATAVSRARVVFELPTVIKGFQEDARTREEATPVRMITELGTHYYEIHRESQTSTSLADLKKIVQITLKLTDENYIVQVIGDSRPFSIEGTATGLRFLDRAIETHAYVLYGYTGCSFRSGVKCVNALTSAYLESHALLDKAIASVVGYQTVSTLSSGSCRAPDLSNYVVVYGDNETSVKTGTFFGDDIETSDYLADRLVLLEGGCQSFIQACNILSMGKPICSLTGLRDRSSQSYFSAAEFLHFIATESSKVGEEEIDREFLDSLKNKYLLSHSLADPKKPHYKKKIALLEKAWNLFVEKRLDKNFYLLKTYTPTSF